MVRNDVLSDYIYSILILLRFVIYSPLTSSYPTNIHDCDCACVLLIATRPCQLRQGLLAYNNDEWKLLE